MRAPVAERVLRSHNRWRRGGTGKPTDPQKLGQALDVAVRVLVQHEVAMNVLRQIAQQPRRTREQRLASSCVALLEAPEMAP